MVDTTAPAQSAPPSPHPKHHWMVPRSWSEWVGSLIIVGVVGICAFFGGEAVSSYALNDAQQQITRLQKDNQRMVADVERAKQEKMAVEARRQAIEGRLNDAFNAYRTIVLDGNDMRYVSNGDFTVALVGRPASDKVSINVNGTPRTVAAGESFDAGVSNCSVKVESFDKLKVTLRTSCPLVLDGNDKTPVSTGQFTVGLVGPPANEGVAINVNGIQHTFKAGDSMDVPGTNCQVRVKSFDMFRVTLLTSCPPSRP